MRDVAYALEVAAEALRVERDEYAVIRHLVVHLLVEVGVAHEFEELLAHEEPLRHECKTIHLLLASVLDEQVEVVV